MIHSSQIICKPKTLEYWRRPTKQEIKFGYGALHYRELDFEKCFDENGYLKLKVRLNDDGLIYYNNTIDNIANLKLHEIVV